MPKPPLGVTQLPLMATLAPLPLPRSVAQEQVTDILKSLPKRRRRRNKPKEKSSGDILAEATASLFPAEKETNKADSAEPESERSPAADDCPESMPLLTADQSVQPPSTVPDGESTLFTI